MKAMVLAAGKGTRLLPLTAEIPKPMAPIVGKPMLQHIFKLLAERFEDTFVVVMGDALTDIDVREVLAFHKERGALATLALMRVTHTSQYGVVDLDGEGNILAFQKNPHPA